MKKIIPSLLRIHLRKDALEKKMREEQDSTLFRLNLRDRVAYLGPFILPSPAPRPSVIAPTPWRDVYTAVCRKPAPPLWIACRPVAGAQRRETATIRPGLLAPRRFATAPENLRLAAARLSVDRVLARTADAVRRAPY